MTTKRKKSAAHNHAHCVSRALATAETVCAEKQAQFTPLRRRVLEIVWRQHEPIGAYEILAELAKDREKAAPPSVYRALDFLRDVGLVHRLDSLNAFLGCDHPQTDHSEQFLVCGRCHRVAEIADSVLTRSILGRMRALGFQPGQSRVEIKAICSRCAAAH